MRFDGNLDYRFSEFNFESSVFKSEKMKIPNFCKCRFITNDDDF